MIAALIVLVVLIVLVGLWWWHRRPEPEPERKPLHPLVMQHIVNTPRSDERRR